MLTQEATNLYYCLFCKTSYEKKIKASIEQLLPGSKATSLYQDKWVIKDGVRSTVSCNMLPGYVFLRTDEPVDIYKIKGITNVIRILGNPDRDYRLEGADLKFAKWVFEYSGLIAVSGALTVNNRIVITEGPLKDFEGNIMKINKRRRVMMVSISFDERSINVWLPFDWATKAEGSDEKENSI